MRTKALEEGEERGSSQTEIERNPLGFDNGSDLVPGEPCFCLRKLETLANIPLGRQQDKIGRIYSSNAAASTRIVHSHNLLKENRYMR